MKKECSSESILHLKIFPQSLLILNC